MTARSLSWPAQPATRRGKKNNGYRLQTLKAKKASGPSGRHAP
ncbi:hypothetical protein C7450_102218 [Chelatococcus asaccharovorans]|uniref:Uncharacterized protein n=1 Tax=Chelatococcus asaccharovorans TaxID=28210 RepID=A0A2V3UDF0_9HYPH|nr:hypothetical protein C7450_102218 [Chelatococcus asaccharovorans]